MSKRFRALAVYGAVLAASAGLLGGAGQVSPSAAAEITWKAVANTRNSSQWSDKWLWLQQDLPKLTKDELTLEVSSFPELGLTGQELIRMLTNNLVDIAEVVTGYVSGEVPLIEGVQLPGVYSTYEQAQSAYLAWQPVVVAPRETAMGGLPIASFAFSSQYLWSKFPANTLEDLSGKKIRVFSQAQTDFFSELGAEPVNIPLAEVYTALERGTVDAVVTGPESAVGLGLAEVIDYVVDLRLGVGAGFVVVSRKSLDALTPESQQAIKDLAPKLDELGWSIGAKDTEANLKKAYEAGIEPTIPAKPEWNDRITEIARDVVVPAWAERSGEEGTKAFNEVIGPIVGFTVAN